MQHELYVQIAHPFVLSTWLEVIGQLSQPPRRGLLYQMGVPAIAQCFYSWSGMNREESNILGYSAQVGKHIVKEMRLNMLQNINTTH